MILISGNLKFSLVHLTKAMKMCTTTLINEKPEVKVQIADAIFEMFKQAGMSFVVFVMSINVCCFFLISFTHLG